MKTKLTLITVMVFSLLFAQKKKNGTIYIEHPYIEIVNEFNEAFVKGNLEKIKSLVSDDLAGEILPCELNLVN